MLRHASFLTAILAGLSAGSALAGGIDFDVRADRTVTTTWTQSGAAARGTIFGDDHTLTTRVARGSRLHLFAGPCPDLPVPADIETTPTETAVVVVPCR